MRRRESLIGSVLRHPASRRGPLGFAAIVLSVCLSAAFALSAVSAPAHANHPHDHDGAGGGCLACAQAAAAQNLLCGISSPARCAIFSSCAAFIAFCNPKAAIAWVYFQTLTVLKVQLNR
ncbi:MAG: hypothetical protein LBL73_12100 [Synergistaceae bacterium]|nr:hypothetical protein [Synergistaceae bacterium]